MLERLWRQTEGLMERFSSHNVKAITEQCKIFRGSGPRGCPGPRVINKKSPPPYGEAIRPGLVAEATFEQDPAP
jgi:hypothetical protein